MMRVHRFSLIVAAIFGLAAVAQPPVPPKEVEDPNAKARRPIPKVDDAVPADAPGIMPPPGVLVVGVHSLPEFMSPALARSDSELAALDLLFEGLVRPVTDATAGRQYEPALALEMPVLAARGREFRLATPAAWADVSGPLRAVTSADVRTTVEKLKARQHQFGGAAGELIEGAYADAEDRCRIILTRGVPDPLSLMTFKILPNDRPDDESFARLPVGSGPFVYGGQRTEGGRTYAVFPANPAFGQRPGRANLPRLKAVWMVVSRHPAADFNDGKLHFMLTRATADLASLRSAPAVALPGDGNRNIGRLDVTMGTGRLDTLKGRRIDFLAVNHRDPALGASGRAAEMRRLLAHAIPREAILTSCFRAGMPGHHEPLDGPFPPGAWPCSPVAGRLDDPDLAREIAKSRGGEPLALELKYPNDEPAVERACQQIQHQLGEFGVNIRLAARTPAELRKQVVVETDFQLAYWRHDFSDDWYDVGALLDPQRIGVPGGWAIRNFMSYRPSQDFAGVLARTQSHRDFDELRTAMRQLHVEFRKEAPFIPLWRLETHVLASSRLRTEPAVPLIEPLSPFIFVDRWILKD
jgi:ABC-type transport system substrate-binding protein